jgi:ribosomal protein S18 acetylase RimI-like enzyme
VRRHQLHDLAQVRLADHDHQRTARLQGVRGQFGEVFVDWQELALVGRIGQDHVDAVGFQDVEQLRDAGRVEGELDHVGVVLLQVLD